MLKKWLHDLNTYKLLALLFAIVLSIAWVSPIMSDPKTHHNTLDVIDRNKEKATYLSATVTIASTALSLMPEDAASPLANELSELSTPLMLIVCVLYFEQFMLTSLEYLSFSVLIPIGLVLQILCLFARKKSWLILSRKLLILAVVCACIVPLSASVTAMIEATFADSINGVNEKIQAISTAFEKIIGGDSKGDILAFISNVATGIGSVFEFAREALGLLIDGVAILLITSCLVPAISAVLFVWCVKSIVSSKMENIEDTTFDILDRFMSNRKRYALPNAEVDEDEGGMAA